MWDAIKDAAEGGSLVAFVVAALVWGYGQHLKRRAKIIESAPESERVAAIAATAEWFHLDISKMSGLKQLEIVLAQIKERARRYRILAGVIIVVAVLLTGLAALNIWISSNKQIAVGCVAVHIRENRRDDLKLEDAVRKIIADMGFHSCGSPTYEANDKPRHLAVEYTIDSEKMRTEAVRLAAKVREDLPEFYAIQPNLEPVDDPKYRENKLGLWLMPDQAR